MTDEKNEITFESLADAIKFVEDKGKAAESSLSGFHVAFKELTGFEPHHRVTALDVLKIVIQFIEPKK